MGTPYLARALAVVLSTRSASVIVVIAAVEVFIHYLMWSLYYARIISRQCIPKHQHIAAFSPYHTSVAYLGALDYDGVRADLALCQEVFQPGPVPDLELTRCKS